MKISRALSLSAALVVATSLVPLIGVGSAQAATPTVVTGGDLSLNGSSGWAVESRNTGTGAFVDGIASPPLGVGSYYLHSNATGDKQFLHMTQVNGVPLAGRPLTDLTQLSFQSYATDGVYSPYVNIPVHSDLIDANNDGIADGSQSLPAATGNAILVYEPTVTGGAWGTSDTTNPSALWRLTRPVITGGGPIPIWTYRSLADWTTDMTDVVFNPIYGDVQWIIGDTSSAAWSGKSGYVDDIDVATTTESATYDLEEGLGSCPVAIDRPNKTLTLTDNCTTDATLTMHDGWTLDGAGYTITVVDPSSGSFTGSVLTNEAVTNASMYISDVTVHGNLATGCSNNLYGIRFNGASGSLTNATVTDLKYGAGSGCQGGNSVDINNLGGATRLPVSLDGVSVSGFQKTGIRANGNVALSLTNSSVASSGLDLITASNSVQISRGARAYVTGNTIEGNDWDGNNSTGATAVLLYGAENVTFIRNVVTGDDTDFGVYVSDDATYHAGITTLTCNLIERDPAPDSTPSALDLWNTGVVADSTLLANVNATGNTVRGFATAYDNVTNEVGGPCTSGPVADLAADGDASSLTATWTAPTGKAFAPVAGYDVTLTPGGATQTVSGATATFNGLSPAKEYTVTVTPVNAAGSGTPASTSATTGPGAATITAGSTTDTTATVDWSVPGTAYTAFDVTIDDGVGGVTTKTTDGDARTWTFNGLDPSTSYTVSVTPRIGSTDGSADSANVTTLGSSSAPGPVSGLSIGGSGTSLTASWTAAAGATDYEATLTPGGQVESTSGTSASFTITPGKEYTVTVVAHNDGGWGPGRSASIDTTLPKMPGKFKVSGGVTTAELTWNPPTPPSPITGYTIIATPATGAPLSVPLSASGLTFPVTVTGLTPNMAYTFTVAATNAFGTGPTNTRKLVGSSTGLNVSTSTVVIGHHVQLTGKVTDPATGKAASGQSITLFSKPAGTSSFVNRGVEAKTSVKGKFSISVKPSKITKYYVVSTGPGRMGAQSNVRKIKVAASVTMSANKKSVNTGHKVTFSGKTKPTSGSTVNLQRKQGSKWVTQKSKQVESNGTYSIGQKMTSSHDYTWRVKVTAAGLGWGASKSVKVVVN